jgi:hypothetical protein
VLAGGSLDAVSGVLQRAGGVGAIPGGLLLFYGSGLPRHRLRGARIRPPSPRRTDC